MFYVHPKKLGKTFKFDDFSDGLVETNQPVFGQDENWNFLCVFFSLNKIVA